MHKEKTSKPRDSHRWLPRDTQALENPKAEGMNSHPFQGELGYIFPIRAVQNIPRGGGESSRLYSCTEERVIVSLALKLL